MAAVEVNTGSRDLRRLSLGILAGNLFFTAGTALFIHEWSHRAAHGAFGQRVIRYGLVQLHLATENVIAAWYSSMLLLSVALAAGAAYALERRQERSGWDRTLSSGWLLVAAVFVVLSFDEIGSLHERLGMLKYGMTAARGWVYTLAVPILAVAVFMLAFAWFRLRRARGALAAFVVGTALFLSDPVFEVVEMALLKTAGAGTPARGIHDALLVVEEGIVELGGAFCFLLGIVLYIRQIAGAGPHRFRMEGTRTARVVAAAGVLLACGVPVAHWLVRLMPQGDTGIPDNWFPAAVLYAFAVLEATSRRDAWLAAAALVLSACFGSGLYGYLGWYGVHTIPQLAQAALAAGFVMLCTRAAYRDAGAPARGFLIGGFTMACALGVRDPYVATIATLAGVCCVVGAISVSAEGSAKSPAGFRAPPPVRT